MAAFPEMPPQLRTTFPASFWNWWQAWRTYMLTALFTNGDMTFTKTGIGPILRSPNGTKFRLIVQDDGSVHSTPV